MANVGSPSAKEIDMTDKELTTERVGPHVLLVTINRPEKRNAVNAAVAAGIDAAVEQSENDSTIRAVVLSSTGTRTFCAGADLNEVAAGRHLALLTERGGFAGIIEAKRTKPWIVAVEGPALAGGMEICLACDMVVASHDAQFGLPEVKRGIMAGAGGVFRAVRRLPPSIAYELLATGEPIDASRAYALGLINRLVQAGEARTAALALATQIAENAPLSVQQSLIVARQALDLDEEALFVKMRTAGITIRNSEDAKEGPRAFLEKRKPVWTGR
jgi:enoyl-CoA hydratase/carnithine racemase